MEKQAHSYYERFKSAGTPGERKDISADFQRFFADLSQEQKNLLRPLLDEILQDGERLTVEGDVLAERIEQMLAEDRLLQKPMVQM